MLLDDVSEWLVYDNKIDDFRWKFSSLGCRKGSIASFIDSKGVKRVKLLGETHRFEKLVHFLETGEYPKDISQTRHRYRKVGQSSNATSGYYGVALVGEKYRVRFSYEENGCTKKIHLGVFESAEEASQTYIDKVKSLGFKLVYDQKEEE